MAQKSVKYSRATFLPIYSNASWWWPKKVITFIQLINRGGLYIINIPRVFSSSALVYERQRVLTASITNIRLLTTQSNFLPFDSSKLVYFWPNLIIELVCHNLISRVSYLMSVVSAVYILMTSGKYYMNCHTNL